MKVKINCVHGFLNYSTILFFILQLIQEPV